MWQELFLHRRQKNKVRVRGFVKNSLVYHVQIQFIHLDHFFPCLPLFNEHQALFRLYPFQGPFYCRSLFIFAQLVNQPGSKLLNYSVNQQDELSTKDMFTFSGDVNLAHILSSVIADGGLINPCSLQ